MKVSPSTPLWFASRSLLAAQGEEFFHRLEKAEKSFDAEDIHDLRVASRRLREGIALFAPCFPAGNFTRLEKQVKKMTRLLGPLRNSDEAVLFFAELEREELQEGADSLPELLEGLNAERDAAQRKVRRGIKNFPREELLDTYRGARDRPLIFEAAEHDPFMKISDYARSALLARAETVARLLPPALHPDQSAAQHELRIAVKRERYRLEILAPLVRDYQELHGTLKKFQEVLGKLHDLDVFGEMVKERVPAGEPHLALLRVIGGRRQGYFENFLKLNKKSPLAKVGERAGSALS